MKKSSPPADLYYSAAVAAAGFSWIASHDPGKEQSLSVLSVSLAKRVVNKFHFGSDWPPQRQAAMLISGLLLL
jgi:hypothetical protein